MRRVTSYRLETLGATTTTTSEDWSALMVAAPVVVGAVGDVLLDLRASIEVTQTNPEGTTFIGGAFRLVWDGEPLSSEAFIELDLAGSGLVDTYSGAVTLRALVRDVAIDTHSLAAEWQCVSADCSLTAFANNATLSIEGKE